jgi:uncharacterized protein YndB with AHSA1/START domain
MGPQQTNELVMRKTISVDLPVDRAFRLYTERIASWWPLGTHSVAGEDAETLVLEPHEGGRIYERTTTGQEHTWGTIVGWEPPRRLVHTWHPGREPDSAQQVEIGFEPEGAGTRVELVHTGWERLGERAKDVFANYDSGWDYVLGECYGGAAR